MSIPKQTAFGLAQADSGKRMIFTVLNKNSVGVEYLNHTPNSGDPFGYRIPLDCDGWCSTQGIDEIVVPYRQSCAVPVQVARAAWRWLQGEGWKRYPETV